MDKPLIDARSPLPGPFPEAELLAHPSPPPPLPQPVQSEVRNADGQEVPQQVAALSRGDVFQLIIKKPLNESDVEPEKGRFSMPNNQVLLKDFLSPDELHRLENKNLEVVVKTAGGFSYCIEMKSYLSGKSKNQTKVLTGRRWRDLVKDNELEEDDVVELWRCCGHDGIVYVLRRISRGTS